MARHSNHAISNSVAVGILTGVAFTFKPVRILFFTILMVVGCMVFWDKVVTQKIMAPAQWSFSTSDPIVDTMDGQWPTDFSPHFRLTWEFTNKSPILIQSFQINGELYRCDTLGQPIDSCDYISRFNRKVNVDLPAGRHKTVDDLYIFNEGTKVPGIMRAKIWATDAIGDSDREF